MYFKNNEKDVLISILRLETRLLIMCQFIDI